MEAVPILIDITGSTRSYVPYTMLERAPVCLVLGKVRLNIVLSSLKSCLISVPPSFRIRDSDNESNHDRSDNSNSLISPDSTQELGQDCVLSVTVRLGTSFVVSYHGSECEVILGRKITITDAGGYIRYIPD